MTQPNRESVYAALASLLTSAIGGSNPFNVVSRILVPVNGYPIGNAPALFIVQSGENIKQTKGIPPVRTFTVHLVVYYYQGGAGSSTPSQIPPVTSLNNLVTEIEGAIGPNLATGFQQLGIPVSSCYISGRIEYWEQVPTSGNWSACLVPVEIVATY